MSNTRMAAWTQIIGTVAVVLGLLLVWEELRANRRAFERQGSVDRYAAVSEPFFQSAELLAASEKIRQVDGRGRVEAAFIETYGHTPAEALVWSRHLIQVWGHARADWESGDRYAAEETVRLLLSFPDTRLFAEQLPWPEGEWTAFVRSQLESR